VGIIRVETLIQAPIDRCFDISRSVDVHLDSAKASRERAVDGVTQGLLKFDDTVTWEAKHFGVVQRLTVRITEYNRPDFFTDAQIKGPFKTFTHRHMFETVGDATLMKDELRLECPLGILGKIADPIVTEHLRKFLIERNHVIKQTAESPNWKP
jgi:ligand-binding SRPBCC domain-containing protein